MANSVHHVVTVPSYLFVHVPRCFCTHPTGIFYGAAVGSRLIQHVGVFVVLKNDASKNKEGNQISTFPITLVDRGTRDRYYVIPNVVYAWDGDGAIFSFN